MYIPHTYSCIIEMDDTCTVAKRHAQMQRCASATILRVDIYSCLAQNLYNLCIAVCVAVCVAVCIAVCVQCVLQCALQCVLEMRYDLRVDI